MNALSLALFCIAVAHYGHVKTSVALFVCGGLIVAAIELVKAMKEREP